MRAYIRVKTQSFVSNAHVCVTEPQVSIQTVYVHALRPASCRVISLLVEWISPVNIDADDKRAVNECCPDDSSSKPETIPGIVFIHAYWQAQMPQVGHIQFPFDVSGGNHCHSVWQVLCATSTHTNTKSCIASQMRS